MMLQSEPFLANFVISNIQSLKLFAFIFLYAHQSNLVGKEMDQFSYKRDYLMPNTELWLKGDLE